MIHINKRISVLMVLCMSTAFATKQGEAESVAAPVQGVGTEPFVVPTEASLTLPGQAEENGSSNGTIDTDESKSVRFVEGVSESESGKKVSRLRPISFSQAVQNHIHSTNRTISSVGQSWSMHGNIPVYIKVSELVDHIGLQTKQQGVFIDALLTGISGGDQVIHITNDGQVCTSKHPEASEVNSYFIYHRMGGKESGPSNCILIICPQKNECFSITEDEALEAQRSGNKIGQLATGLVRVHYLNQSKELGLNIESILENPQTSIAFHFDSMVIKAREAIYLVYNHAISPVKSGTKDTYAKLNAMIQDAENVFFVKEGKVWMRTGKEETPVLHHLPYQRYTILNQETLGSFGTTFLTEYSVLGKALNLEKNAVFFNQDNATYSVYPAGLIPDEHIFLQTFMTPGYNQVGYAKTPFTKYAREVQELLNDFAPKFTKIKRSESESSLGSQPEESSQVVKTG